MLSIVCVPSNCEAANSPARRHGTGLRRLLSAASAPLLLLMLTGCAAETLFQSSFNTNAVGSPPAANQAVGTVQVVSGAPGSVVIVGPVPNSSENWVKISRATSENNQSPISVMQGNLSQVRGDGSYGFLAALYIPSGSGLASIEFDTSPTGGPPSTSFLHLDFIENNTVRINDDPAVTFGTFPRDQVFVLSVGMDISASSAVAHMALLGTGASGSMDYNIPLANFARQYGAIRLWMGWPWTGSFNATDILVTRKTQ
jgi:hypothetical protein